MTNSTEKQEIRGIWRVGLREILITLVFCAAAVLLVFGLKDVVSREIRMMLIRIDISGDIAIVPFEILRVLGSALGGPLSGLAIGFFYSLLGCGMSVAEPVYNILITSLFGFLIGLIFRTMEHIWNYVLFAVLVLVATVISSLICDAVVGNLNFFSCFRQDIYISVPTFIIVVLIIELVNRMVPDKSRK